MLGLNLPPGEILVTLGFRDDSLLWNASNCLENRWYQRSFYLKYE